MRTLRVTFEDKDYKKLLKAKGEQTWHDFLLNVCIDMN